MAANQEEILANFQSITQIDDVGLALENLLSCNWDLCAAINRAIPSTERASVVTTTALQSPQTMPKYSSANASNNLGNDFIGGERFFRNNAGRGFDRGVSSTSASPYTNLSRKQLKFMVTYKDIMHNIIIYDNLTVGDLKGKIMEKTLIPINNQIIKGLKLDRKCLTMNNTVILNRLKLTGDCYLTVEDSSSKMEMVVDENEDTFKEQKSYQLNIHVDGRLLKLKFPGKQTYLEIKSDIYSVTDIPVRHQEWTGWPLPHINNSTPLYDICKYGELDLTLKRKTNALSTMTELTENTVTSTATTAATTTSTASTSNVGLSTSPIQMIVVDESIEEIISSEPSTSSDEFEDATEFNADDEMFSESQVADTRLKTLIPEGTDDETVGSLLFVQNYIERYGSPHPVFFQGSLEDALNSACQKPAIDRKLLAIYLHHDGSVLTNVFCDRLLKSESIMQILEQNYILYGWDLTIESNKNLFLSSIAACINDTASITAREFRIHHMPSIMIIGKTRSVHEVLSVIHGNVGIDELLVKLMDVQILYNDQRDIEVREENERAERELVKMEQDAAYNESLEIDRRKEEARIQQEYAIESERVRIEIERQEIEAVREEKRLEAENSLPPEPSANATGVTHLRLRTPTGEFLQRRFDATSTLDTLYKFSASNSFPLSEYKILSSFPRRDFSTFNPNDLLNQLFTGQDTVTIQER